MQEQNLKNSSGKGGTWQQQSPVGPGTDNSALRFSYFQNRFRQPSKCHFVVLFMCVFVMFEFV